MTIFWITMEYRHGTCQTEMNANELNCTQMNGNLGPVSCLEPAEFFPVAMTPTLRNHWFPKEEISKLVVHLETE